MYCDISNMVLTEIWDSLCVRRAVKEYHKRERITLICKQIWSCERITWNPAESLVCDVSRQLNVLHQAALCSNCYDIQDIAIHESNIVCILSVCEGTSREHFKSRDFRGRQRNFKQHINSKVEGERGKRTALSYTTGRGELRRELPVYLYAPTRIQYPHKAEKFGRDTSDRQTLPKLLMIDRIKISLQIKMNDQPRPIMVSRCLTFVLEGRDG
ncbi:hypothetical protein CSKR_107347 [Clonorchis sinensis]|uniref:Uncharacterized protein n=1 Tax=Clonorchis sinensis TaxID=79923 RepID=A0A3R7GR89_CLOSI|nr:hypothetical protein CSKR_107347 [Clonorchis sinensis]